MLYVVKAYSDNPVPSL